MTDVGGKKLAAAITHALPPLEKFEFTSNPRLSDPGVQALRKAYKACREHHEHKGFSDERREQAATEIQSVTRGKKCRQGRRGSVCS